MLDTIFTGIVHTIYGAFATELFILLVWVIVRAVADLRQQLRKRRQAKPQTRTVIQRIVYPDGHIITSRREVKE